ncbi:putative toxin-antitoxin system toxin component, PIN family [Candidatus Poribacteria bacterium]|nr:putative toxin-antitoxin system toxin component, PIN family [Candidatus Poribacteria bacterium]
MPNKRKLKVVLDSVVLVSAFVTKGLAAELVALCREKTILYMTEEILQEVRRVLLEKEYIRSRYKYPDSDVEIFVSRHRETSTFISPLPDLHVIERDRKDDKILACACAAEADYIVSRDRDLLDLREYLYQSQRIKIVTFFLLFLLIQPPYPHPP